MKILKRPKFKRIVCHVCGCVFIPSDKDILTNGGNLVHPELRTKCPVCGALCTAEPRKKPQAEAEKERSEG